MLLLKILKYYGFNSKIMHCKYLRSPSAITVVGMLDNRNILSIMHRMIRSWLNALLILGFRRMYIAQAFPTNPKIIKTVEMTPVNQNFHSIRLWKREYFGLGIISHYIYSVVHHWWSSSQFKILCVVTWAWSFLTSQVMEAVRGRFLVFWLCLMCILDVFIIRSG